MKKEKILEASRKENLLMDERVHKVKADAGLLAASIGVVLCVVIIIREFMLGHGRDSVSYVALGISFSIYGVMQLYTGLKLGDKLAFAEGAFMLLTAIVCLIALFAGW